MEESALALPEHAATRLLELGLTLDEFAARLFEDPVFMLEEIWHDRNLNRVAPLSDIERDMCYFGANPPGAGFPNRRIILAPRGIGKTHAVTAVVTCWDQYRGDGESYDVIVSKSDKEAKKTITLIRQWIDDVWFLQHLKPEKKKDHRDAATYFDVGPATKGRNPSVSTYGIETQIEGVRANRVIGDDVETTGNTKTHEARQDLDHRVREFAAISSYGDRDIVYVGTYHHEESLYIELSKRGYLIRTYPELYPAHDEKVINLAPILQERLARGEAKPGDIVFAHRRDEAFIREKQAEGRTYFAMQHMLIADLGDALRYPLQLRDLIVFAVNRDKAPINIAWGMNSSRGDGTRIADIPSCGFGDDALYAPIMHDPEWAPFTGTKMWIDPSGQGEDMTAYAIVAQLNGYLWCKACEGVPGGFSPVTMDMLAGAARRHRATEILVESNFGMDMFASLFEPTLRRFFLEPGQDAEFPMGWKAHIEGRFSKGQKELRIINSLEPVMGTHRLIVDPSVARNEKLQRQLTRITRERNSLKHEDELETLAACVGEWQLQLNTDPAKAAQSHRDRLIEDEIKAMQRMAGMTVHEPTWFRHQ